MHLGAELEDFCVSLPTQNILSIYLLHVSLQISRAKGDLQTEMTQWDSGIYNRKERYLSPSIQGWSYCNVHNTVSFSLWPWARVTCFPPIPYCPKCSCVWSFIKSLKLFNRAWKKNISEFHWNWDGNYTVNSWREAVWCWKGNIRFVLILYLKEIGFLQMDLSHLM